MAWRAVHPTLLQKFQMNVQRSGNENARSGYVGPQRTRWPDGMVVVLEQVEGRVLLSGGPGDADKHAPATAHNVVYVMSNNPTPGKNSILAYRRSSAGKLTPIGEFRTGGTGYYNANERLGPDDSDQEIMVTPDRRRCRRGSRRSHRRLRARSFRTTSARTAGWLRRTARRIRVSLRTYLGFRLIRPQRYCMPGSS
jgi:hypothetical protein